jgi:hypothetical protein
LRLSLRSAGAAGFLIALRAKDAREIAAVVMSLDIMA